MSSRRAAHLALRERHPPTAVVDVSIVIAAHHEGAALARCLSAVEREIAANPSAAAEIIVASASPPSDAVLQPGRRPRAKWIDVGERASVPELRAAGLVAASGEIVALLEDHLEPLTGWLAALLRAHGDAPGQLAIGGSVDPSDADRAIDRGAYFCEYGWHMSPLRRGEAKLLTGANISYKRAAVELFRGLPPAWETVWHRVLRERGYVLLAEPDMIVRHERRFSARQFVGERVRYGRDYALERSRSMPSAERVARALAAPLLPLVLLCRLAASVAAKRTVRASFLRSLPWTFVFFAAWSVGEARGYLAGPPETRS